MGACAQRFPKIKSNNGYDDHRLHFGFLLGLNNTDFRTNLSVNIPKSDSVFGVHSVDYMGFNLGIVSNLKIGNHWDLRFVPDLSFTQRDLNFDVVEAGKTAHKTVVKTVESTFVEFPLELKYKSVRVNNYRMYAIAGMQYAIDMASRKKDASQDTDKKPIKLDKREYGYTIGFGMDFYLTYVKVSPQIKMYNSLSNVLIQDGSQLTGALRGLYTRSLYFSLTFE